LRRAIQKNIEDRLSEELLRGNVARGNSVVIDVKDGKLVVEKEESRSATQ
jgi:ATP-dependent Clp protease ATP-binding subunit ClpC